MYVFLLNLISFIPNSNYILAAEWAKYTNILLARDIPCHLTSCRVKTFESARLKHTLPKYKNKNIYELHDLISFRFVFYNKDELLKFYHYNKIEKDIIYFMNYIDKPKDNGYKALHFHYRIYDEKIDKLECQLFVLEDYYDSLYGNSSLYKNYLINLKD